MVPNLSMCVVIFLFLQHQDIYFSTYLEGEMGSHIQAFPSFLAAILNNFLSCA